MGRYLFLLRPGSVLLLILGCAVLIEAQNGGVISFGVGSLAVSEGPDNVPMVGYTSIAVPMVRVNGTQGVVGVTVQIQNQSATDHFQALNVIATFNDGDTTASAIFSVINNNTPKPNQTYLLQIVAIQTTGVATIGAMNTMLLTTLASDQPSGIIQFNVTSIVVSEPVGTRSYVQIPVVRGPGIYGAVSVNFQITQGPNLGLNDLSPTYGSISFGDLVAIQNITLAVLPNTIPTPNVTFVVTLLNPGGGALLATTGTQASITIVLNNAPIRFNQSAVQVAASAGSFLLTVTRGFLAGSSTLIGPVASSQSTINYATADGMALANADYVPLNGTLTFPPGVTSQTITVYTLNNPVPHGYVNFTVYLFSPSPDCILYPPSTVTVTILLSSNAGGVVSFASSSQVVVNRDGYSVANLTIQRSGGMITSLMVAWSVRNADNSLASQDFLPPNGTIVIPAGQSQAVLSIKPLNDGTPQPAELFYVRLEGVLSGLGQLNPMGTLYMTLIVADSNDFYGLIEWANTTGTVTVAAGIRTVQLNILRQGAANGIIVIMCSIFYQPPGSTSLDPTALATPVVNVTMQGGQMTATLMVQVQTNAFLDPAGNFYAFLNSTSLIGGASPLITPTNSPRIGVQSLQVVPVGVAASSGAISFAAGSLVAWGQVPAAGVYAVPLQVVRSGSFGQATVSWIIAIGNPNNVNSTVGTIIIQNGATSANFSVFLTANHVPELDQQFNVTLTGVAEANQRLLPTQNQAVVTIPAHDYPAGVFSFNAASVGPFYIPKSPSALLILVVQRTGGALTNQQVVYSVVPDGASHFYGATNVLYFGINQWQQSISLAPIVDGIPQTNKTFTVTLSFPSPTTLAAFGSPSNVSVTILATADFRGVLYFLNTSLSFVIVQPHVNVSNSKSILTLYRDRGTFGTISALWVCTTAGANGSISPTSGEVVFLDGQRLANFTVSAIDNGLPEPNIAYFFTLVQATGGALLGYQNQVANVTVLAHNDPIRFATSFVNATEGTNATFVVARGGRNSGVAIVNFAVIYQTASSSDVIVYPPGGAITFQDGQNVSLITMVVLDDGVPELDQTLVVTLVSLSGDAVLVPPTNATLLIPYNNDPNGLFQFAADSRGITVNEGTYFTLNIERLKGTIGMVQLQWGVVGNSTSRLSPNMGFVTFGPGETNKSVQVLAVADGVPALEQTFDLELFILANTSFGTNLAYGFELAMVTIPDSNYPYGVFTIPPQNQTLFIALNVPTNNPGLGVLTIPVQRTYGLFGLVQVTWEIYNQVIPPFLDLLLVGLGTPPQAQPRPYTGTKAVNFTGAASYVISVPPQYYPNISSGFTISCWINPYVTSNGVLIAKTNSTTSTIFYALSLAANGTTFIIKFRYLPSTQTTGYQSVQTSVPTSSLAGGWHSLAVSISGPVATLYVDGAMVGTSMLQSPPTDGVGVLTVGGLSTGGELYTGAMQDARIYSSPLNSSQINAINNSSVGQDLRPTSGVITYLPQVMTGNITFASVNHSTPEPNKYFYVVLTASNGGSQISSQGNVVQIIELKGNNANGIFGFASNLPTNISEPGNLLLTVTRQGGTFDTVTLTWMIVPAVQGVPVIYDFVANTSQVEFPPGVTQATLTISTFHDDIPSFAQRFTVVLVSVVSSDGLVSSTPTSGASINSKLSQWNITVLENDYPYGLLQFNTTVLPPPGTLIPPATSPPIIYVNKSNRTAIMVYVARAMGHVGTIHVEYYTYSGTASSSSATPDYVSTGGGLTFSPTDQVMAFPVIILDNQIPELWKSFYVGLANPSGDLGVPGLGSPLTITIRPSHNAAGVFAFSASSSLVVVMEGSSATVTIVRGGGSQGNASVSWFVVEQTPDITPTVGMVTFTAGQTSAQFVISAVDDMTPEFQEVFHLMLANATDGSSLNSSGLLLANISIPANHYPCGLFVFDAMYRALLVNFTVGSVELAVSREFGTAGNVGVVYTTLNSSSAAVMALLPAENIATTGVDYVPTSGTLWFAQGETIKTFNVTILTNTIPKLDIYIFVNLTSAFLVSGAPADPLAAPSVSSNESIASVVIAEHNNARGIIEFDSSFVVTVKPSSNFLLLRRKAGAYGVVTASWSTIPGSATAGSDYVPTSGTVTFQQGDTLVPASLAIIDDNIPRFNQSFTVILTSVGGGAVLGTVLNATVIILASHDPNGALEFNQASLSMLVNKPPDGTTTPVILTVQRLGGSYGVIGVDWFLAAANGSDNTGIQPQSGNLVFLSAVVAHNITLWLQPDNVPSITEEFDVTLVNPTGGARVTANGVARIFVLAHDNPYGTVSLLNSNTILAEGANSTVEMIPIIRSGGTFEDLVVTYSIQQLDLATLATSGGTSPLAYFFAPIANTTLTGSLLRSVNTTLLGQCASACLSDETCLSFSQLLPSTCQLYLATAAAGGLSAVRGASYYEKNQTKVRPFLLSIARSPNDFIAATGTIIFPAGASTAGIPVVIVTNHTPELDESFSVTLLSVKLRWPSTDPANLSPSLGAITVATGTILAHDDPYGRFYLTGSNGGNSISVPKIQNLAVVLTVQRQGGTIGNVAVGWIAYNGTAQQGKDFIATGAILPFPDGVTSQSFIISILNDGSPSQNEDILIALVNPTGGAVIAPGGGGVTDVVILASNRAAGIVGLSPLSRSAVVGAGNNVTLVVQRQWSALGVVQVGWNISGGSNVTGQFSTLYGTAIFAEGVNTTAIVFGVVNDSTPKLTTPYVVQLTSVLTLSPDITTPEAIAVLDPSAVLATITVNASNYPHGVVEFQQQYVTSEQLSPVQLTIVREYGTFGAIDVTYQAMVGTLRPLPLPNDTSLATLGVNFQGSNMTVRFLDGQQSVTIAAPILADNTPELNKVFLITLLSVTLVNSSDPVAPPIIGALDTVEVTILPHDNPQGVLTFGQTSLYVNVTQSSLSVPVLRAAGTFGAVSVTYYVVPQNATNGSDFIVANYIDMVTFAPGQSVGNIAVTIIFNTIPSLDKSFCITLYQPQGGAILGNLTTTCVVILAHNDPYGVFSISSSTLGVAVDAASLIPNANVATITVVRGGGTLGAVAVPFQVQPSPNGDLSPLSGAVQFRPMDTVASFQLTASINNIPSLNKTYNVTLLPPTQGRLDYNNTVATVTILAHSHPYGLFGVFAGVNGSSYVVEETAGVVNFTVTRSYGLFGNVTVLLSTVDGSALANVDYVPLYVALTFAQGESTKQVSVAITDNNIPRIDGVFYVVILNTTGGADIGGQSSVNVTILSHDNAYGLIGFANASLSVVGQVLNQPNQVQLVVVREAGVFGEVHVIWNVSNEYYNGNINILPSSGEVVFLNGSSMVNITLYIQPDHTPELSTIFPVTLQSITQNGVPPGGDPTRGAHLLPGRTVAYVTIAAHDDPYGVFVWSPPSVNVSQSDVAQSVAVLNIVRLAGTVGTVQIQYSTTDATGMPSAQSGVDYVPVTSGTATLLDGETVSNVSITILPQAVLKPVRCFLINITGVTLMGQAEQGVYPRIITGQTAVTVCVLQDVIHRGVININAILNYQGTIGVAEDIRSVFIPVNRTLGTVGTVGVTYTVTGVTATAGVDFTSNFTSIQFSPGQTVQYIRIDIMVDSNPHPDKTLTVTLTTPIGGCTLGGWQTVTVTIFKNADYNGVFSYTPDSLLFLVPVSQTPTDPLGVATLKVQRTRSFFGTVTVYWEVELAGRSALYPTNGTVVFPENVILQTFQVRTVNTGVPQPMEAFLVRLVSLSGAGGRIAGPSSATIAIQATTTVTPVIGFSSYPAGITIAEGSLLTFQLVQSVRTQGTTSSASWAITPADSSLFATVTDTVLFTTGLQSVVVSVQTLSNTIPTVPRAYTITLVSTTQATLNTSAASIRVYVKAANSPHGVVQFAQGTLQAAKVASVVAVPLQRGGGVAGTLVISFSVQSYPTAGYTAQTPSDFIISSQSVTIPDGSALGSIPVQITNDMTASPSKLFAISLTSVLLQGGLGANLTFSYPGDPSTLDQAPSLGTTTQLLFTILQSGNPYGTVNFNGSLVRANVGDIVQLNVTRTGTYGTIVAQFVLVNGLASRQDYTLLGGGGAQVIFNPGQTSANIFLYINSNSAVTSAIDFSVVLTSVSGGGNLGNCTTATVIIAGSAPSNGIVGFTQRTVFVNKPSISQGPNVTTLAVNRTGGTSGVTSIQWVVTGPTPGSEALDISASTLQGTLTLQDGQSSGFIMITVLPTSVPAVQKTFTVSLTSASNNVAISTTAGTLSLVVSQYGNPYGVISFIGNNLIPLIVNELDTTVNTFALTLVRTGIITDTATVTFTVSGNAVSQSVSPTSGSVTFQPGSSQVQISLGVLPDGVPELDNTYTVTLTSATGAATIDALGSVATFIIPANNFPYGQFGISNPQLSGDMTSRSLSVLLFRQKGVFGTVQAQVSVVYDPRPVAAYVNQTSAVVFGANATSAVLTLPVATGAFLAPYTYFTLTITNLTIIVPAIGDGGTRPSILLANSSAKAFVSPSVSNPLIGFDQRSLEAHVDDSLATNNVQMNVTRQGLLGVVTVTWSSVGNGSITPSSGTLVMGPSDSMATFSLTAKSANPYGAAELFAVQLSAVTQSNLQFPAAVDPTRAQSIIEPRGVVQILPQNYTAIEGQLASVIIWRRYGSSSDIVVTGVGVAPDTSVVLQYEVAAVPGVDFVATPLSVTLLAGSTLGVIQVPLPNNTLLQRLRVFQLTLLNVVGGQGSPSSPRLLSQGPNGTVTIIDAQGGSGIFGFAVSSVSVQVLGSPIVPVVVYRTGGSYGRVSVTVATYSGTPTGMGVQAASGQDYLPVNTTLVFDEGVTQLQLPMGGVQIIDNNLPSVTEYFTVSLGNPPGGFALLAPSLANLVVAIGAHDYPGGTVAFTTPSPVTLIDSAALSATVSVGRSVALVGSNVTWTAVYPVGTNGQSLSGLLVTATGTLTFQVGQLSAQFILTLNTNQVPQAGVQFLIQLSTSDPLVAIGSTSLTVNAQTSRTSVFQFAPQSRNLVATQPGTYTLTIQRVDGLMLTSSITYSLVTGTGAILAGMISLSPALATVQYTSFLPKTVTFTPTTSQVQEVTIQVNVISVDVSSPLGFQVVLSTSQPNQVQNSTSTIVVTPSGARATLLGYYFSSLIAGSSFATLESLSAGLLGTVTGGQVDGQDTIQAQSIRFTLNQLTQTASAIYSSYSAVLKGNIQQVFDHLLQDPNFSAQSELSSSLKSFGYSLLSALKCGVNGSQVIRATSFYLEAVVASRADLHGRVFSSGDGVNYLRLPSQDLLSSVAVECLHVCYVEYIQQTIFGQPTLNNMALSVGIQEQTPYSKLDYPLTYRISSGGVHVLPTSDSCIYWSTSTSSNSSGLWIKGVSSTLVPSIALTPVIQQVYVDCQSSALGDLAVAAITDSYGWTLPAAVSCAFVTFSMLLVILLHLMYFKRTQSATRIFIMLCLSVLAFQLVALADMFATHGVSSSGCVALGVFLQLTVLAQFIWILSLVVNLWLTLMGLSNGRDPLFAYVLASWGISIVIVVLTVVIGHYAVSFQFTDLYGLTADKSICFMPNLPAALVSTALPIVVAILLTVGLLSHSCYDWSRWEDLHNMYYDSFNKKDIPLLLSFFLLISVTSLVGGLQMYLTKVYWFGAFVALNTLQGIYALVVYFFLGWKTLGTKHKKYGIGNDVQPLTIPGEPDFFHPASSFNSSQHRMTPFALEMKERHTPSPQTTFAQFQTKERRTRSPQSPPIIPLRVEDEMSHAGDSEVTREHDPTVVSRSEDSDNEQMDSLVYAIKTNTAPEDIDSDRSSVGSHGGSEVEFTIRQKPSLVSEEYQFRRISIANTHL